MTSPVEPPCACPQQIEKLDAIELDEEEIDAAGPATGYVVDPIFKV
jgi:hypothetical protein